MPHFGSTVVDKAGDVATGLRSSDFEVMVDGRFREIVSADFVAFAPADEAAGKVNRPDVTTNAADASRRNVLIVVDQSSLRPDNRGVLEGAKRPVSATADHTEVRDVLTVEVSQVRNLSVTIMFDPEHDLEERILKEQFAP